jgi:hypothetical protein
MDRTTLTLVIALGALLLAALIFSALMGGMMGPGFTSSGQTGQGTFGPGMMRGHGWMWEVGMGFGALVMAAFWGVVIVGVILLIPSVRGADLGLWHDTPLNLLKRRYASGQITRKQ